MADVVRFKGFNLESDAFVEAMDILERDRSSMRKIATTAADMLLGGGSKQAFTVVYPLVKKWLIGRSIVDKLVEKMPELEEPRSVGGEAAFTDMMAKVVAKGLVTDMYESPLSYRKVISPDVFAEFEQISVERGKQKLRTMLENRGRESSERVAVTTSGIFGYELEAWKQITKDLSKALEDAFRGYAKVTNALTFNSSSHVVLEGYNRSDVSLEVVVAIVGKGNHKYNLEIAIANPSDSLGGSVIDKDYSYRDFDPRQIAKWAADSTL